MNFVLEMGFVSIRKINTVVVSVTKERKDSTKYHCPYGKKKSECREGCGGGRYCKHEKEYCNDCGGNALCKTPHCPTVKKS